MLTGGLKLSVPLAAVWLLPALVVVAAVRPGGSRREQRRVLLVVRTLLAAYLVSVGLLTLWPLRFDFALDRALAGNWTPFGGSLGFLLSQNPYASYLGGRDVLANVVAFGPLGLLGPFASSRWRGISPTLVVVCGLALCLELSQGVAVAERTFDMDDVLSGAAGGALGAVLAAAVHHVAAR